MIGLNHYKCVCVYQPLLLLGQRKVNTGWKHEAQSIAWHGEADWASFGEEGIISSSFERDNLKSNVRRMEGEIVCQI